MLWKVQQDFCQQSSSTSPRPPTTTAGTRLEPMTSSPISGPASSPISGSGTSGLGISGSTTSGLACGSNSSVSSQYSSSAYSACSPPTSTSFWRVLSNFRFKIRFWSNSPCFDELFSQLPVQNPVLVQLAMFWRVFSQLFPVSTSTSGSGASGSKLHLALTSFFWFLVDTGA